MPPSDADVNDPAVWDREALLHERLFRQFRAVGDGLAWRVFQYDRTIIAALASNKSPGPLVKRTGLLGEESTGLAHELRSIEDAWTERRRFALHHDLTNCLRIGDLTEVEAPGRYLLHEVKANPRNHSAVQRARMHSAVRTIESGTPLPGTNRRILELDESYQTDLQALIDVIDLARQHGTRGARLADGRALLVTSLSALERTTQGNADAGGRRIAAERKGALRRAGINEDDHHFRGASADLAARIPLLAPWAIYPLRPDECAGLICDALVFEVIVSTGALVVQLKQEGLGVRVLRSEAHETLDPQKAVLQIWKGDRQLNVFPNALAPLLYELLQPATWARGTVEMLGTALTTDVWQRYDGDDSPWLPQVPPRL